MRKILLVEDDRTFSRILEGFLVKNDFKVQPCFSGKEGIKHFSESPFDLVLLDYRLPDLNGLEVLTELKESAAEVPVIIMTSFSDIRVAVSAIKAGAYEYITKPVNPDELLMMVKTALNSPTGTVIKEKVEDFVKGESTVSKKLHEHIDLVAPTNISVIIEGESGTGKEYVARSIHKKSQRSSKPFVAVDCGVLSKDLASSELFGHKKGSFTGAIQDKSGQFVEANGGTLFLDEIGNLPYEVQIKLLRALQERVVQPIGSTKEMKVDVRIIVATNEDLAVQVKRGNFREDLYHRLNEFKINVPALRDRPEDLFSFMEFFRHKANLELDKNVTYFSPEVIAIFNTYEWPGNLRELKNVIKRAVLLSTSESIGLASLPEEMGKTDAVVNIQSSPDSPYDLKAIKEVQERELIAKTLAEVRYNKSKAARILNIDRKTLYLKMEKYGLK